MSLFTIILLSILGYLAMWLISTRIMYAVTRKFKDYTERLSPEEAMGISTLWPIMLPFYLVCGFVSWVSRVNGKSQTSFAEKIAMGPKAHFRRKAGI